jgi:hypothetical protein
MSCISPDDPKVSEVIANHEDLELAMFLSKTLVAAIMDFTTKRDKAMKEVERPKVEIGASR